MQAIIMSGGEGTRLRPLTCNLPKPMVPIMNKPSMEYIINILSKINIKDISVTTYYLPTIISDYFGNGDNYNVNLKYYIENTPLGTGGSVLNIDHFPKETFIVISGDCVTDIDLEEAIQFHKSNHSKATLLLKQVQNPLEYGIVILDNRNKITRFLEKPNWGEVFSDTINTGIYILEPEIFNTFTKGDNFDFSKDLFPKLLKHNIPMFGFIASGYWCDVGDLISYKQTQFDILDNKVKLQNTIHELKPGVFVDSDTLISKDAIINSPVYIGKNCVIKPGCLIDSHTIIGDDCVIDCNSSLKKCILWNNVHLGKNTHCRSSIISNNTQIGDYVNLYENSIISNDCHIHNGVSVKPDIKIWPSKSIPENSVVSRNLVWGSKLSKVLFGNTDIHGEVNSDITPEYATLLGSTFAVTLKTKNPVVISADSSPLSKYIMHSIVSGVLSAGLDIIVLEDITTSVSRFAIQFYRACAGIHIRKDADNSNIVHLELFNSKGGNIDRKTQKSIEQLFYRGDIARCIPERIGSTVKIDNFQLIYGHHHSSKLKNLPEIKDKNIHILLSSKSELVVDTAVNYLSSIGCSVTTLNNNTNNDILENHINHMSTEIKSNAYDIGVLINDTGESLIVFDKFGNAVMEDKYYALSSLIALKCGHLKKLILPINSTNSIKKLAEAYNTEVVVSKSSSSDIMNEMLVSESGVDYIPEQFILNFDGIAAIGKILDYLVGRSLTLDKLLLELPEFHMKRITLDCDIESRGYIVRKLIEDNSETNQNIELLEGIKINTQNGWSLVIPDNERPLLNIYSEGFNEEYAEELAASIKDKIKSIMNSREL